MKQLILSPISIIGMIHRPAQLVPGMSKRLQTRIPLSPTTGGHGHQIEEYNRKGEFDSVVGQHASVTSPHTAPVSFPSSSDQKFVPGTKMNSTNSTRAMTWKSTKAIHALLSSNFRIYGSLMRDQFMKVYSLKPKKAMKTSSLYW